MSASIRPPTASWAADPANDVAAVVIDLPAGADAPQGTLPPSSPPTIDLPAGGAAAFTVPPAAGGAAINRKVYIVEGEGVSVEGQVFKGATDLSVRADAPLRVTNPHPTRAAQLLLLQGRPIGEPVAQQGPFVMNTRAELAAAFEEYQVTRFGGWPWDDDAPVFPRERGRFASRGAGQPIEYPPGGGPKGAAAGDASAAKAALELSAEATVA